MQLRSLMLSEGKTRIPLPARPFDFAQDWTPA